MTDLWYFTQKWQLYSLWHKGDGHPWSSGSSRSPHSMDVVFWMCGNIQVQNNINMWNIKTSVIHKKYCYFMKFTVTIFKDYSIFYKLTGKYHEIGKWKILDKSISLKIILNDSSFLCNLIITNNLHILFLPLNLIQWCFNRY